MLFQTPPIAEREAEVIGEIERIRRQLDLPRMRAWPGLPWRAIHDRLLHASKNPALGNLLFESAGPADEDRGAEDDGQSVEDAWAGAPGYHAALSFALQLADAPGFAIDEGVIRALHYMMVGHDPKKAPGHWRRGSISVTHQPTGGLVYTAPHAKLVPGLIAELVASLNARDAVAPAFVRAAMAHLNLAAIHPFADGNGRMARTLHTFVLACDGVTAPPFASIDEYLSVRTPDYYRVLDEVDQGVWRPERDARPWVRFCLSAHLWQARALAQKTREYDRFWDELEREVGRHGLPDTLTSALAQAAIGGELTLALCEALTLVPVAEAAGSLESLARAGLLVASGAAYRAADTVQAIYARTREPRIPDVDPFAG